MKYQQRRHGHHRQSRLVDQVWHHFYQPPLQAQKHVPRDPGSSNGKLLDRRTWDLVVKVNQPKKWMKRNLL